MELSTLHGFENLCVTMRSGANYSAWIMDVEPVFGFLKANLSLSQFSVTGKSKVENEWAFALMAVDLRSIPSKSETKKTLRKQHFNVDSAIFLI